MGCLRNFLEVRLYAIVMPVQMDWGECKYAGEQEEYDRVKDKYLVQHRQKDGSIKLGPRTRNKWYEEDLAQLAQLVGKMPEYDTFIRPFHGCVHSAPLAVSQGPLISPKNITTHTGVVVSQLAQINVRYNQLDLGADDLMILDQFSKSLLSYPASDSACQG